MGVFTASQDTYAKQIVEHLDPTGEWVDFILCRTHCVVTDDNIYLKDLRVLNRPLDRVVLVDNAAYSFYHQLSNGIPIIPFYDNKQDTQLLSLQHYLLTLLHHPLSFNRSHFNLHKYKHSLPLHTLLHSLYSTHTRNDTLEWYHIIYTYTYTYILIIYIIFILYIYIIYFIFTNGLENGKD